jgi:hypothetical protein
MPLKSPKNKGAAGEREAAEWLQKKFNLEHLPQRNLEQVRFKGKGRVQQGHDLIGFEPFGIEVKRQEVLSLRTWWRQAKIAAHRSNTPSIPVVMYRQNRKQWKFLISANHIGIEVGYLHLESQEFIDWVNHILNRIAKGEDVCGNIKNLFDRY